MFHAYMRNIPELEDIILTNLGPRDLVNAKQVSKGWAGAVRRYVGQLQNKNKKQLERTSDLMEQAFLEPVQMHATVKLPQKVRDLTINGNGKVFILGEESIMELDTCNFHVIKNMVLERKKDVRGRELLWDRENKVEGPWLLFAGKTGRQFQLKNHRHTLKFKTSRAPGILNYVGIAGRSNGNGEVIGTRILPRFLPLRVDPRTGLQASDVIQLPNGIYMCAVEKDNTESYLQEPRTQIYVFGKTFETNDGNRTKMERLMYRYATIIAPKLIAVVPMSDVRLCVVGTRVFCYNNGTGCKDAGLRDTIIVFDAWNPASVETLGENVEVTEETPNRVSKRRPVYVVTPCILCKHNAGLIMTPGGMYICNGCIHRQYISTCNICNHGFFCEHMKARDQLQ